jgi:replication factor A1
LANEKLEAVISKILKARPDLSKEKLMELVNRKRAETGSLLNLEGAIFLIASELGVKILDKEIATELMVKDLASNLSDVSLTGRVLAVYPAKAFQRPSGEEGMLRKILLGDKTGMVEVYLWNQLASEAEKIGVSPNSIVRVEHGYTRRGLSGRVELHAGRRSSIKIVEENSEILEKIPSIEHFFTPVSRLNENIKEANIRGRVISISPVKTFARPTGEGKVMRIRIRDETGEATLVLWDEKTDEALNIKPGYLAEIVRGTVREDLYGGFEIHAKKSSQVRFIPSTEPLPEEKLQATPISQVKPGERGVTIEGVIVEAPTLKEVTLKDGSKVKVAELKLKDETGTIRVSAWREHGEILAKLPQGLKVRLKGVTVKEGFGGEAEVVTVSSTAIEVIPAN